MTRLTLITTALCLSLLGANTNAQEALLQTTANPAIEQGYVNTPDGQLHYWQAGAGPALLLVHQSSSSGEEYAAMVPLLKDKFRLVAFDWPGHGSSDDPVKELGVDEFTASALAVLDHLDISDAHVLGNHGGALIAMNLAWKHPQRVNSLILSGTSGVKEQKENAEFAESLDLEKRNHVDIDGKSLADAWQRYVGYMPNSSAEKVLIPFRNNVSARLRPYDAHYGVLRWDRRPALANLKDKQILLMQGEGDDFVSRQETLLKILPKAERVVIEDAGVFMFFEKPEAIANAVLQFLAQ